MSRLFVVSVLGCATSLLVTGCAAQLDKQVDDSMTRLPTGVMANGLSVHDRAYGAQDHVSQQGKQLQRTQLVRYEQSPWVGGIQTVAKTEDKLPAVFNENFALDFGEQRVPLGVVAARLTKMTGIPVRVRAEEASAGKASTPPTTPPRVALPTPLPDGHPNSPVYGHLKLPHLN